MNPSSLKAFSTKSTALASAIRTNQGVLTNEAEGGIGKIVAPGKGDDVIWWFQPRTEHNHPVRDIADGFEDIKSAEIFVELLSRIEDAGLRQEIFNALPAASASWMRMFVQNYNRLRDIATRKPNPLVELKHGDHTVLVTKGASPNLLKKMKVTG